MKKQLIILSFAILFLYLSSDMAAACTYNTIEWQSCNYGCGRQSRTCNACDWFGCGWGGWGTCNLNGDIGATCITSQYWGPPFNFWIPTELCFDGPGTVNVGKCRYGTHRCINCKWGTCEGQVVGTTEICNNIDDDCDGTKDNGNVCATAYYCDSDGDGIKSATATGTCNTYNCVPSGCTSGTAGTDCNDANATIKPGATEICDGIDNNCIGGIDEGCFLNIYWSDLVGNEIIETNLNDLVRLTVKTSSGANGQTINFTINSSCKQFKLSTNANNGEANVTWISEYCSKNWTFNATFLNNQLISNISKNLSVLNIINNANPVAIILSPKDGQMFNTGIPVGFNQSSYDIDDFINWTWDFGDGYFNTTGYNTTHPYTTGGPKTVNLTINSIGRNGTSVTQVKILIDKPGEDNPPLAIISAPKNREEGLHTDIILFNASLSIDDLTPKNMLNFTWDFGDGKTETKTGIEGALIQHSYVGQRTQTYNIKLTVFDQNGNSSSDSISLRLTESGEKCGIVPTGQCGKAYGLTPVETWCSNAGSLMNNCTQCPCPATKFCSNNTYECITPDCYNKASAGSCGIGCFWNSTKCLDCRDVIKNPATIYCSFYNGNSNDCAEDKCGLGGMSQGKCIWDAGKSTCTLQKKSNIGGECSSVMCSQSVDCQNELYNVTCSSYPIAREEKKCCDTCQLTKTSLDGIACGGSTAGINAVLPLFGWLQLIIAIFALTIYYAFYFRKVKIIEMI